MPLIPGHEALGYVVALGRSVKNVKEGDVVEQSKEFGFIKFGSRVDIFLPVGTKVNLELNQVVKGGITVLAELA